MKTIRELKQQEKYKSMLKRKNKEKKIYKDKNASLRFEKQKLYRALLNREKEIERLNNKINSIFSNFEQFINSYKNDNLDDFFIGLRLSEVVEFYNDLKEVIKSEF